MSDDDLTVRIAEVLGEHAHMYWYDDGWCGKCVGGGCEQDYETLSLEDAQNAHAAHQAEQVRAVLGETK